MSAINKLYWDSYSEKLEGYSIPKYLESNASYLRSRYLEFVYDVGETDINGKSLIKHLEVAPDFSAWWMSLVFEKSFYKSSTMNECLKMIALEEILIKKSIKRPVFYGVERKELIITISNLCSKLGVKPTFSKRESDKARNQPIARKIYNGLPYILQGLAILVRHLFERWSFKQLNPTVWFKGTNNVFFFSYFLHLDADKSNENKFYSRQWEILPQYFVEKGFKLNWIHHFQKNIHTPNSTKAIDYINGFNSNADFQGMHTLLDAYLSFRVVIKALYYWHKLIMSSFSLASKIKKIFVIRNSNVDLWPLVKDDWYKSISGSIAMKNCIWLSLFDVAMRDIPHQAKGYYLYEGMGWERAFVYAWRKHEHGDLTGVFHASLRFWDLRWIHDPRIFGKHNSLSLPVPDNYAVNGPVAKNAFIESGYPEALLIEVEALRYIKVVNKNIQISKSKKSKEKTKRKLLVLGDIIPSATQNMMEALQDLPQSLLDDYSIMVKPHPALSIVEKDYLGLDFQLTNEPLDKILHNFDCIYGVNSSSANLDAYLAGLPVIVYIVGEELVTSPLRGMEGAIFVGSSIELEKTLNDISCTKAAHKSEYFWTEDSLPRWSQHITQRSQ